jgi:hypothetical protein
MSPVTSWPHTTPTHAPPPGFTIPSELHVGYSARSTSFTTPPCHITVSTDRESASFSVSYTPGESNTVNQFPCAWSPTWYLFACVHGSNLEIRGRVLSHCVKQWLRHSEQLLLWLQPRFMPVNWVLCTLQIPFRPFYDRPNLSRFRFTTRPKMQGLDCVGESVCCGMR